MYSKFESLDEEKRERILNAVMAEFSLKGYDHASTNAIVQRAGIAKGLLFHYFKSKKHLFLYLYHYCVDKVTSEVYLSPAAKETDFFAKMRAGQEAKLALLRRYPELFAFMRAAYLEESHHVKPELEEKNREFIGTASARFLGNIDYTKFKDGLDVSMAINVVLWSLEGYTNQYLLDLRRSQGEFDFDRAAEDAQRYLRLFEQCFYP